MHIHILGICGTFMGGTHPDTGATFIIIEPQVGGWGAYSIGDGCNANFVRCLFTFKRFHESR